MYLSLMSNSSAPVDQRGVCWDEVVAEIERHYRANAGLVEALSKLPAHQVLGLALGILAGTALRISKTASPTSKQSSANRPRKTFADAGGPCAAVLEEWLCGTFDDPAMSGVQVESLGAFHAAMLSSSQIPNGLDDEVGGVPVGMRVASRVAGEFLDIVDEAPTVPRKQRFSSV